MTIDAVNSRQIAVHCGLVDAKYLRQDAAFIKAQLKKQFDRIASGSVVYLRTLTVLAKVRGRPSTLIWSRLARQIWTTSIVVSMFPSC